MKDERLDYLIDQHLNGALSQEERCELEERLLRSSADRARFWELADAHVLVYAGLQQHLAAAEAHFEPAQPSLAARVRGWLGVRESGESVSACLAEWFHGFIPSPKQFAALAGLLVAVLGIAFWFAGNPRPGQGASASSASQAPVVAAMPGTELGSNLFTANPDLRFRVKVLPPGPVPVASNPAMVTGLRSRPGDSNASLALPNQPVIK